jgi:hypothetical protein
MQKNPATSPRSTPSGAAAARIHIEVHGIHRRLAAHATAEAYHGALLPLSMLDEIELEVPREIPFSVELRRDEQILLLRKLGHACVLQPGHDLGVLLRGVVPLRVVVAKGARLTVAVDELAPR